MNGVSVRRLAPADASLFRDIQLGAQAGRQFITHARDHVAELRLGVIEANLTARQLDRRRGFAETGPEARVLQTDRPIREIVIAPKL